jgi:hypothetical protein
MSFRDFWRRIATGRYTRSLEREVGRLRAENRALLNSILGIAGVPPLPVSGLTADGCGEDELEVAGARANRRRDPDGSAMAVRPVSLRGGANAGADGQSALPLRRRSWQQINRMLELESARKKAEA